MLIVRPTFSNSPVLGIILSADIVGLTQRVHSKLSAVCVVFSAIFVLAMPQAAVSQTRETLNAEQVSELLTEIESKNRTRSVYDVNSRRKIGEVAFESRFKLVKNLGKWSIVEFNQQTVPGWVSRNFVSVSKGRVTVNVNNLNMRDNPSLNSNILTQLSRGYTSDIVGRKNGFIGVLAPNSYRVALFSGSDQQARQSQSPSSSPNGQRVSNASLWRNDRQYSGIRQIQDNPTQQKNTVNSGSLSEPAIDQTSASSERLHIIAPGDAVSLLVFGESDLSIQNVRVPQSGRVSFPLIGSVLVAGQTIPQVEESVAELLAQGYVKNPRLSVTMFSYRPVFIRGAIQQTGSFPFSEGLTVGKAIALAGGSKKSAKQRGVSILREGKVIETALSVDSQIEVQSGDVISIEEEVGVQEDDATYIYLHGEVASPGEYQFRRGLTVEKAIVLAGGFTLRASRKKISVTRYADVEIDQEPEKLKKVKLYTPIRPGDIINVGASWF